jgi:TolA-binding protein
MRSAICLCSLVLLLAACGGDEPDQSVQQAPSPAPQQAAPQEPSRSQVVAPASISADQQQLIEELRARIEAEQRELNEAREMNAEIQRDVDALRDALNQTEQRFGDKREQVEILRRKAEQVQD